MKRKSYLKSNSLSKTHKSVGRGRTRRNRELSTDMDDNDYVEKQRETEDEDDREDDNEQEEATEADNDGDDDSEEPEMDDDEDYEKPKMKKRGRRPKLSKNLKKFSSPQSYRNTLPHHSKRTREKQLGYSSDYKTTSNSKHEHHKKKSLFHLRLQLRPLEALPKKSKIMENNRNNSKKPYTTEAQKFQAESFIMKLFDRSLDLSKYTDKTALYPICRAWMSNQPRNPQVSQFHNSENYKPPPREDNCREILSKLKSGEMTILKVMPRAKKTDKPKQLSRVIPRVYSVKENIIPEDNKLENADCKTLLSWHKKRWQNVRENWQNEIIKNRKPYSINLMIMAQLCKGDLINADSIHKTDEELKNEI